MDPNNWSAIRNREKWMNGTMRNNNNKIKRKKNPKVGTSSAKERGGGGEGFIYLSDKEYINKKCLLNDDLAYNIFNIGSVNVSAYYGRNALQIIIDVKCSFG